MSIFHIQTKGFTLLETLASIGILALVIIGPLAVIVNSSSYARKTKDTIVATHLAEEAMELIQNQYDSLYVFCQEESNTCLHTDVYPNETAAQATWRIFKERFTATSSQPSCYIVDNPSGCAFDFLNMKGDITTVPERYVATASECSSIGEFVSPVTQGGVPVDRHMYLCKGVPAHIPPSAVASAKNFRRSITVEKLPAAFESTLPEDEQYYDDLRVTTRVSYQTLNGASSTVAITRFMHARQ